MAQWIRSLFSAAHQQETVFLVSARDYISNATNRDLRAARDALLHFPNMNTTGRLPAVALLHLKKNVRLTVAICPAQAPVDSQGIIDHIELDAVDRDRWERNTTQPICVIHMPPLLLLSINDLEVDTGLGPGIIAVEARLSEPFNVTVDMPSRGVGDS